MRLAIDAESAQARSIVKKLAGEIGEGLAESLLSADQRDESGIAAQRGRVEQLKERLEQLYFERHPDSFPSAEANYQQNRVDFLTSGLFAASRINTVSPTFLREIAEDSFSDFDLIPEPVRRVIAARFEEGAASGILNAPMPTADPRVDPLIHHKYGTRHVVRGKQANKLRFQEELKLFLNRFTLENPGKLADFVASMTTATTSVTITGSTIDGNDSTADGGGIYQENGTLTIERSTISDNGLDATTGDGGGIYFRSGEDQCIHGGWNRFIHVNLPFLSCPYWEGIFSS